ncbi:hypothetical protein [Gordonia caeni]
MTDEQTPPEGDDDAPEYFPGERRRTVPKAAWAVLAVALAALLILLISRPAWLTHDVDDQTLQVPADRHFSRSLVMAGDPDGIWLSDETSSRTFEVRLPVDSAADQTRLHLVGTSTVPDTSTAFLSVAVDGQLVDRQAVPHGSNTIDRYVDIPEQAVEDGEVRIRIYTDGERHEERCTADHSAGMLIHLDSGSLIEAALAEPVRTVRDAVASWSRNTAVVVADDDPQWLTAAAQVGLALIRNGYDVEFTREPPDSASRDSILVGPAEVLADRYGWSSEDRQDAVAVGRVGDAAVVGVTTVQADAVARFLEAPTVAVADSPGSAPGTVTPAPVGSANEVPLEALGADTAPGQITETRRWGTSFALADLPGGRLPSAAAVSMTLPASPDDITWILTAELNGRLVGSVPLNPTRGDVEVPLPESAMLLDNSLTLTVSRDRDLGGCDVRVSPYPIQLNETSALRLGSAPGAGFTALPRQLNSGAAVYLPGSNDDDPVVLLNRAVPVIADFVSAQEYPDFQWDTAPDGRAPFIVVGDSDGVDTALTLRDGRLVDVPTGSVLNVPAFTDGLLVQTAAGDRGGAGLSLMGRGQVAPTALPDFGRADAQVVTAQGGFVVEPGGAVVTEPPIRQSPP